MGRLVGVCSYIHRFGVVDFEFGCGCFEGLVEVWGGEASHDVEVAWMGCFDERETLG
jgi:hypothetical protein